ncbi:serine/threonine-protein kinase [Streptomyces klenkii]
MGVHPGNAIGGRYRLIRLLGAGGFGEVWEAHDPVLGVDVAVKRVRLTGSVPDQVRAEVLARAAREARNAARLRDHPNIVTVYDVVGVDGVPWIVMQLVDGTSLADELKVHGPLTVRRTVDIAAALVHALIAAHQVGVMHRDVKPANVMLAANGSVLLTDFGIAVAHTDPRLTHSSLVIGSPAYMAPERWQGAPSDGRSDLFSLGVTLYEAVEGVLPFPAGNPTAALTEMPRPPERAGYLASLLIALLERNPAKRPTASQVLEMLALAPNPAASPAAHMPKRTAQHPRVALSNSRARLARRYAAGMATWGVWIGILPGAAMGMDIYDKVQIWEASSRFQNAIWGVAIMAGELGFLLGLLGLMAGASARSDVVKVDQDGLAVTRWPDPRRQRPSTFTVRWDAIECISIVGLAPSLAAVDVRFREENTPTDEWIVKHKVVQLPDGDFRIYRNGWNRPQSIDPDWLHDPLRQFAGSLYDDPDRTVDP